MAAKYKYWFVHDDRSGMIYESGKFGLIVIFDGFLKFGEPFYFHNAAGETPPEEETREIIEAITGAVSESVK